MMAEKPRISAYRFGEIVIDGVRYRKDVLILPDRVIDNWWRESGHNLTIQDVEELLDERPTTIVIGTGAFGRMRVPEETRQALSNAGCTIIVASTKTACDRFNQLEDPGAAAALHLTC